MVRRLSYFSCRVRHRGVPGRERMPDRCNASGSAVSVLTIDRESRDGGFLSACYGTPLKPLLLCLEATLLVLLRFFLPGLPDAFLVCLGRCWGRRKRAETPAYLVRVTVRATRSLMR